MPKSAGQALLLPCDGLPVSDFHQLHAVSVGPIVSFFAEQLNRRRNSQQDMLTAITSRIASPRRKDTRSLDLSHIGCSAEYLFFTPTMAKFIHGYNLEVDPVVGSISDDIFVKFSA